MNVFLLVIVGLVAGTLSGLLGVGGGIILVPALVYMWGFSQHLAQGTTLALLVLPIGLLAAYKYYVEGNVNLSFVAFLAAGFFVGGLLGAYLAHAVPDVFLKRIFGVFFLFVALRMIFF